MLQIVRFLARADRFHGAWPHFLDGRTGRVNPYFGKYDNGGDLVETAFLVQGLLAARQYFNRQTDAEREIRDTITVLWRDVEWDWYRKTPDSEVLYWHWSPDHEWHISHPLIGWNETLIVYLLAIASPTHGVPASLYHTGWAGQSDAAVPVSPQLEPHHAGRPLHQRQRVLRHQAGGRQRQRRRVVLHAVFVPRLRSARQTGSVHELLPQQSEHRA